MCYSGFRLILAKERKVQKNDFLAKFCELLGLEYCVGDTEAQVIDRVVTKGCTRELCGLGQAITLLQDSEVIKELDEGILNDWLGVYVSLKETRKKIIKSAFPDFLPKVGDVIRISAPNKDRKRVIETSVIYREKYGEDMLFKCSFERDVRDLAYDSRSGNWTAGVVGIFDQRVNVFVEVIS